MRAVDVRPEVIKPQSVYRGIGCAGMEMTGVNDRNFLPGLELRRGDIGPMNAPVSGQVDQPIVGSGPNAFDIKWRWRNCIDDTSLRGLGSWLRAILANGLGKFESLARQIGTNLLPVSPAVPGLPQCVGGEE